MIKEKETLFLNHGTDEEMVKLVHIKYTFKFSSYLLIKF